MMMIASLVWSCDLPAVSVAFHQESQERKSHIKLHTQDHDMLRQGLCYSPLERAVIYYCYK